MLQAGQRQVIASDRIADLIGSLQAQGFQVLGPVLRDSAIVYDEIHSSEDLPVGWTDNQEAATYRLAKTEGKSAFGYTAGVQSWKKFLHPAHFLLFRSRRVNGSFEIEAPREESKVAFLGVRACELAAIRVLDRVYLEGPYRDRGYEARRKNTCIVAVNCTRAGGTCFCASMKTGPRAGEGYDLSLTEIPGTGFLVDAGTALGEELLSRVVHRSATAEECRMGDDLVEGASKQMGRAVNTDGLKELLYRNYEHRRWQQSASRCLSCANCTMVCPTCFCTGVEDVTDLSGDIAERRRRWDSCFTLDFSYIHGGNIRASAKSRYRQWVTHKLATWVDQFGTWGCVGCGRCITWCPAALDLTGDVAEIRASDRSAAKHIDEEES